MDSIRKRIRPIVGVVSIVAVAVAWYFAFYWGAAQEWPTAMDTGDVTPSRGTRLGIWEKKVETPVERDQRINGRRTGLNAELRTLKEKTFGVGKTKGNDVFGTHGPLPDELLNYTPREACEQMRLQYPDKFKDVDCASHKFDANEPWSQVTRGTDAP